MARLKINKNKKSECVSGTVQGAGPNVEAGHIRSAGRSLGTPALDERAQELDRQAQEALKERERLTRSLTLQRRLRKAQRELEEA